SGWQSYSNNSWNSVSDADRIQSLNAEQYGRWAGDQRSAGSSWGSRSWGGGFGGGDRFGGGWGGGAGGRGPRGCGGGGGRGGIGVASGEADGAVVALVADSAGSGPRGGSAP